MSDSHRDKDSYPYGSPAPVPTSPDFTPDGVENYSGIYISDDYDPTVNTEVQFTHTPLGFSPCGLTVPRLKPDMYDLVATDSGRSFKPKKIQGDSLILLPNSKSELVLKEIKEFWNKKDLWVKHGLVHKRGFLLWGPQGSGKTSTVIQAARALVADGGLVIFAKCDPYSLTEGLKSLKKIDPSRNVIAVIEDIDAYIANFNENNVLSMLDGEDTQSGIVFIATTNFPERLEARVVNRPSRFDKVIKIDMPDSAARGLYIASRGLSLSDSDLNDWVSATEGFGIAHIKEFIISVICLGHSLEETKNRLQGMYKPPDSNKSDNKK